MVFVSVAAETFDEDEGDEEEEAEAAVLFVVEADVDPDGVAVERSVEPLIL